MRNITQMQKAGRTFLLRLVAEHGPDGAARILRALADEIEWLMRDHLEPEVAGGRTKPTQTAR